MKLNTQFKYEEGTSELLITTKSDTTYKKELNLLFSKMKDDRFIVKASAIFYNAMTSKETYENLEQSKITFGQDKDGEFMTIRYASPYTLNRFVNKIYNSNLQNIFMGVGIDIVGQEGKADECDVCSLFFGRDMRLCSDVTLRLYYESAVVMTKDR